jgi:hypothetical protein
VAEPVRRIARRETATVAMVLIAAFQALLGRYADQDDVAVASPAANRPRPELERLIGTFSNIVVVRTDLSGSPGFLELLGRVRAALLGAHMHQELSFDRVVEELRPERDPSRHPLVQVMLNFRQAPAKAVELPGVRLERIDLETSSCQPRRPGSLSTSAACSPRRSPSPGGPSTTCRSSPSLRPTSFSTNGTTRRRSRWPARSWIRCEPPPAAGRTLSPSWPIGSSPSAS